MCGIVGFAGFRDDVLLSEMNESIVHRGPDGSGQFVSDSVSMAMRRLSIIDVEAGNQPVCTQDGGVYLTLNGEILNYRDLKSELMGLGYSFKTDSDTEVSLYAYVEWGLEFVDRIHGFFAFAIFDRRETECLHLIRDRFGVKPLYYHQRKAEFRYASELKAILRDQSLSRELDPQYVDLYLKIRYVPGPGCLLRGFRKVAAGTILTWKKGEVTTRRFWSSTKSQPALNLSRSEALELASEKFEVAMKRRLVADVPVGAYLSGGVDSSLIVARMRQLYPGDLKTFSVGFGGEHDELSLASETANRFGTDHREILCTDGDFAKLESIVYHLDEPIGDAIVVPMYLLSEEAAKHVKVVLSGEGADEVFGGYFFSRLLRALSDYRKRTPKLGRWASRKAIENTPHSLLNRLFDYPAELGEVGKLRALGLLDELETSDLESLFLSTISLFTEAELNRAYDSDFLARIRESGQGRSRFARGADDGADILKLQYEHWLPEDILMKLDKMTMAHSLEGREPFLDHELFEFAARLPSTYHYGYFRNKTLLRSVAKEHLPPASASRRKVPFYIPIDTYFEGKTFRGLFEQFREENYLGEVFGQSFLDTVGLSDSSVLGSKKVFSLIMLNLWAKRFVAS